MRCIKPPPEPQAITLLLHNGGLRAKTRQELPPTVPWPYPSGGAGADLREEKRTRLQAEATELSSRLERLRRLEAEGTNLTEQLRVLSSTLSAVDVS